MLVWQKSRSINSGVLPVDAALFADDTASGVTACMRACQCEATEAKCFYCARRRVIIVRRLRWACYNKAPKTCAHAALKSENVLIREITDMAMKRVFSRTARQASAESFPA